MYVQYTFTLHEYNTLRVNDTILDDPFLCRSTVEARKRRRELKKGKNGVNRAE